MYRFLIHEMFYDSVVHQMLGDDFMNLVFVYTRIECPLRIDDHNRAEGTQTEATGLDDFHFVFNAVGFQFFLEDRANTRAIGRSAAGAAANKNVLTVLVGGGFTVTDIQLFAHRFADSRNFLSRFQVSNSFQLAFEGVTPDTLPECL